METGANFWYYTLRYCRGDELKRILIRRGWFSEGVMRFSVELVLKEIPIDEVYDVLNEYLYRHPEIEIPRGFMTTEEVLELHHSGLVEVGAHTLSHPILKTEDAGSSHMEVVSSVERLSDILGAPVKSFAYPNGIGGMDYDRREMSYVKGAGIDMAFSVDPGTISPRTNPLSIPRCGSVARLRFGSLGMYLPSRANQQNVRKSILNFKLR